MASFLEDVFFPETIAMSQLHGSLNYSTTVTVLASGVEQRIVNWSESRHKYDAGLVTRKSSDWVSIINLYSVVKGRGYGFRLKDPQDYSTTQTTGFLQPLITGTSTVATSPSGTGYGVPTHQIVKRYTSAANTSDRWLRKIRASTYTIYKGGVAQTEGIAAGNYALDTTTGVVTFVASDTKTVSSVTVGATTQVTLSGTVSGLSVGKRLYLSGLAGANAATLNGLSHAITAISVNTYTLSTVTTGLTITAGSGVAAAYPQASDTLTVVTNFDVPVRFDTDELPWQLDGVTPGRDLLISTGSLPLVEIKA